MTNFKAYSYNSFDFYHSAGSFTWTKPSDIDDTKPILVHVWGAGGSGHDIYYGGSIPGHGGGGGGLAVKLIDVSNLNATETITIGGRSANSATQAGSSSFGSHCSASGGNSGVCETSNEGSNGGVDGTNNYGVGGKGSGGDVNRRGGTGGTGAYANGSENGGGGGGSAPAPYGYRDGFKGGNGHTLYASGGGGGIACQGQDADASSQGPAYTGGAGGGTMGGQAGRTQSPSTLYMAAPGPNGLIGTGGQPFPSYNFYYSYGGGVNKQSWQATGDFVLTANEIALYGGGGNPGQYWYNSSERGVTPAGNGGPGGGGGGLGKLTTTGSYQNAGHGGFLGGGGGSCNYSCPGHGGNAGGSGGVGYYTGTGTQKSADKRHPGGDGVVIIQYARLV